MKLTISRMMSLMAIPCLLYLTYIAGSWGLAGHMRKALYHHIGKMAFWKYNT